jgi:hypothetical protein
MSDQTFPQILYTVDPTAPPVAGEYYDTFKADPNGALWIRPITLGLPQTADHPDADGLDPAAIWAFDVRAFNYIWDPVAGQWDREQRYTPADDMPDIEARTVLSFNFGHDDAGNNWDRLRVGGADTDAGIAANETTGILKVLARLYGLNDASGAFERLRSADTNSDGQPTVAAGALETLARLTAFNGLTWDRLVNVVDNADAQGYLMHLLATMARLEAFNGATFDRLRTTVDNSDAVAAGVVGLLGTMARGLVWNGADFMRDWKSADFNAVTSSSVGAASASILAASDTRRYLLIQNTHATQTLYINFGAAASATTLAIIAGGNYEPLVVPTDEIFAYGSGAATTYVIVSA